MANPNTYTVEQYEEAVKPFDSNDTITIADSQANLEALDPSKIAEFVTSNVDIINCLDDVLSWNVAQWDAAVPQLSFDNDDFLILSDTGANISAASAALIGQISAAGATLLSPTDGEVTLSLAQYDALGGMNIDASAEATLSDSGANLQALTIGQLGALEVKGIDILDASNDAWTLSAVKYLALGAVVLAGDDTVTLADTAANIKSLSLSQMEGLAANGVDIVSSSDILNLTGAQYTALSGLDFAGAVRNIVDTGANIAALDFGDLADDGFSNLDATDDVLKISVNQYSQLGDLSLTAGDAVTLYDTGNNIASLNVTQLSSLAADNIDAIDASNDVLQLEAAQLDELGEVTLTAGDVVTLADGAGVLENLSAAALTAYGEMGVDLIVCTEDSANISVEQIEALLESDLGLSTDSYFILSDTGENLASLSAAQIGELEAEGISEIDASDDVLSLTVAVYLALGAVALSETDTVTLADTAANIKSLSLSQMEGLAANGVDIVSSSDILNLTGAQYTALSGLDFAGAVRNIVDTGANIAALDFGDLADDGFSNLDATDDVLKISVNQYSQLGDLSLTAGDAVTLYDTGNNIASLNVTQLSSLAADNIDAIDASNDVLQLEAAQLDELGEVTLTAGDVVTLADGAGVLENLSAAALTAYGEMGVDLIVCTEDSANISVEQIEALLESDLDLSTDSYFILSDTGENLASLSAAQIGELEAEGISEIDASDDVLSLTVAVYLALGAVALSAGDVVTLADTGVNLATLTADEIGELATAGIDIIDATDGELSLTVAQFNALGDVELTMADDVTLLDTGATLAGLDADAIDLAGDAGIDTLDATDDILTIDILQAAALYDSEIQLTSDDTVTMLDSAAQIAALSSTDIGILSNMGVDVLASTEGAFSLTAAQLTNLVGGGITALAADTVTVTDTAANLQGIGASIIGGLAADNIDAIDSTDDSLNLRVDQYLALGTVALTDADQNTIKDTGANIAAMTALEFGGLAAKGIDRIDASNNSLALTVAQFQALGAVSLTGADVISLRDSGANISALSLAEFGALAGKKIDAIDATDNELSISIAQFNALGSVQLASGDVVTLADTSSNIQSLSAAQLIALGGKGVDRIDATDDVLTLSVSQLQNLGSVTLAAGDEVTLADTAENLEAMTLGQFASLHVFGVDIIDATDDSLTLDVETAMALGGVTVHSSDEFSVRDSAANIEALSDEDIADLADAGVDQFNALGTVTVNLTAAQVAALGSISLSIGDSWVLNDTGANIAALSTAQLGALADLNLDAINASDDALNLSVAQYRALGDVSLTGGDLVTLRDTGSNLASLTVDEMGGLAAAHVDKLDASNDVLSLTANQLAALDSGLVLAEADFVTVTGAGADIAVLGDQDFGGVYDDSIGYVSFVDRINASDNVLDVTLNQVNFFANEGIALTANDLVTASGSQGELEAITAGEFADYKSQGVDVFDSDDDALNLTAAQTSAIVNIGLRLADEDNVGLVDTSANIMANLGALLDELGDAGVDYIDTTDDELTLTAAQAAGLSVYIESDDFVTLLDTSANIEALTAEAFAGLSEHGVDVIDATDDELDLSVAQYLAGAGSPPPDVSQASSNFKSRGLSYTAEDDVTLLDTGAHIAAMSVWDMAGLVYRNIDAIDATDNVLNLNTEQVRQLVGLNERARVEPLDIDGPETVALTGDDFITMEATGEELANLSPKELNLIFDAGVDTFDLTDGVARLSNGQYNALRGHGSFQAKETVEITGGSGANLIIGGRESNILYGLNGADTLAGGAGKDVLYGGKGEDVLSGGRGADTFVFEKVSDSNEARGVDRIADLNDAQDVINLANIDASNKQSGDQAFTVVAGFTGHAGELTVSYDGDLDITTFAGDVNGDGEADLIIEANGNHLTFDNFVL